MLVISVRRRIWVLALSVFVFMGCVLSTGITPAIHGSALAHTSDEVHQNQTQSTHQSSQTHALVKSDKSDDMPDPDPEKEGTLIFTPLFDHLYQLFTGWEVVYGRRISIMTFKAKTGVYHWRYDFFMAQIISVVLAIIMFFYVYFKYSRKLKTLDVTYLFVDIDNPETKKGLIKISILLFALISFIATFFVMICIMGFLIFIRYGPL